MIRHYSMINSPIESSKFTTPRMFTFCANIEGYVTRSRIGEWRSGIGITFMLKRRRTDQVCTTFYVSKQNTTKAQYTSVFLGCASDAPMTSLICMLPPLPFSLSYLVIRSVNAIFKEICIFSPSLSNQSNSNHSQEGGEGSSVYDVRTKECVCLITGIG